MKRSVQTLILSSMLASIIALFSCTSSLIRQAEQDETAFLLCSARENFPRPILNADRFGFFSSRLWQDYEINLQRESSVFGVMPGYVLWYIQMGDDYPIQIAEENKRLGIRTVINHDIKSDGFTNDKNLLLLNEIADGKWDDYFKRFARQARDHKSELFYRFGYEMNGGWFPWGEKPEEFVKAWRHVWKIFKKEKADNVSWIFSPSVVWGQQTFKHHILPYYPGDQYVDIVALDGYNFGDNHTKYHRWESFRKVYAQSLHGLMSFNKRMWIAEIGCPTDPRRYHWLQDFLEFFDQNSCFEVFFWFNEDKEHEPNFRIDADKQSLKVFRDWAQKSNLKSNGNRDELAMRSEDR